MPDSSDDGPDSSGDDKRPAGDPWRAAQLVLLVLALGFVAYAIYTMISF